MTENAGDIFRKSEAVLSGHFQLTSGLHSPVYWEKCRVLQFPQYTGQLCRMISEHYRHQDIQVVAGPTTGGIILSFEVARQLGVRGIFAEKKEGTDERVFRRGFTISPGERVLIVDDILTTGSSVFQLISAIGRTQGNIVGIGVLVDRSQQPVDFGGIPVFSCHRSLTITYPPSSCPLCAAGIPLVKPGGG